MCFSVSIYCLSFWAGAAQLNPILYVVNAFRYGILGVSDISLGLGIWNSLIHDTDCLRYSGSIACCGCRGAFLMNPTGLEGIRKSTSAGLNSQAA